MYALGGVVLLEFLVFAALYRWTRWQGKQIALLVGLAAIGLFLPFGVFYWKGLDQFAIHIAFYAMVPYGLGIITTHWEKQAARGERSGQGWFHWAPATIVAFFLALAVVDAVIITVAENGLSSSILQRFLPEPRRHQVAHSTFPGTIYHDYQEKEAQFNAYLKDRQLQEARGWKIRKGWEVKPEAGTATRFKVEVRDSEGTPLLGAHIIGRFLRPSDSRLDLDFELQEVGQGLYARNIALPAPGRWDLVMLILHANDKHEVRAHTAVAKPVI